MSDIGLSHDVSECGTLQSEHAKKVLDAQTKIRKLHRLRGKYLGGAMSQSMSIEAYKAHTRDTDIAIEQALLVLRDLNDKVFI